MHHRVTEATEKSVNGLTEKIIGAAIEVHRELGPGLLESAYEECLAHELTLRRVPFNRQQSLPITYKAVKLDCGYRLDLLVEQRVIVEIKAVERIIPIHQSQLLSYLRLSRIKWGLLLNFNVPVLRQGMRRMAN
ncbi:MAG: GxxExxY protein [Planctomycetota bacterium]|nr:MAG: GxxExxY protein [Planctomycetota bacterium]